MWCWPLSMKVCNEGLGLPNYVHCIVAANESLHEVRRYLNRGDERFTGLKANEVLRKMERESELWVLPQLSGRLEMYRWDQDYSLVAAEFVDPEAMSNDGKAKLFVEVRLVDAP